MAKRGLGRGLGALIPSLVPDGLTFEEIPIDEIVPNPSQPRQAMDAEALSELVASIKKHGVMQPVLVRPKEDTFELVAGERRLRAAQRLGLSVIPAIIKESNDGESLQLALVENIQREDLNAIEEGAAYKQLTDDFGCTQAEIAELVGKNRATVSNTMRLLQLPGSLQKKISEGRLSSGHARALLGLNDQAEQTKLAERIISEGLSVRQTEELVRLRQLSKEKRVVVKSPISPEIQAMAKKIGRALKAQTRVKKTRDKFKIELVFSSVDGIREMEELVLRDLP